MQVSIVTISYNQVNFLERAICSVLEQDYPDIEYIVVDPGSTDGSLTIIKQYQASISKVIIEPDHGPADGLNKGFSYVTGEICSYLNADDAYLPGAISQVVTEFKNRPKADVICGHGYIVDEKGLVLRRFFSNQFTPWRFVHGGVSVMQQSTFFRRQSFINSSGFNPANPIWWDAELLLDFSLANQTIVVVNHFWSIFTLHHQSISGMRGKHTERANQLELARQLTYARLYQKVTGHQANDLSAKWGRILARLQKWVLYPRNSSIRLIEIIALKLGFSPYSRHFLAQMHKDTRTPKYY